MFIPLMLLGILPFLQLGVSYYASFGMLGVVILLWYQRRQLHGLFRHLLVARLAVFALMVIVTWGYPGSGADVLRAGREGVFYFLLTGCAGWRLQTPATRGVAQATRGVAQAATFAGILFAGLLALVLAQTLFLSRGIYFGIPKAWFSQNAATIAGELDLYYSDIRPNGPYGEPSYLGGVCLCLLFAFGPLLSRSRVIRGGAVLAMLVVILSRSFSGIVFCLLMVFGSLGRLVQSPSTRLALGAAILCVCTVVATTDNTITARLDRLNAGEDSSSMARIVQPLVILPDLLIRKPTGMPMSEFMALGYLPAVGVYAEELSHNALINLILNYGWVGLLAIGIWLWTLPDANSRLFACLLAMQNGALLTPDKFVLMALSLMIYNSCRAQARLPVAAQAVPRHDAAGRGATRARPARREDPQGGSYRPIREVEPWL
jgi:hypothetical protein